ncbi:MAG: Fe-S cluster assembly sulfur transfer protein SufU [Gammaproteobacteria bacterium]
MLDLKDLYQEVIVDHNRNPRNFGKLENPDKTLEGFNPLCGDRLTLYLKLDDGRITDISFDGSGCAISVASASMMTEAMRGRSLAEAEAIFAEFHALVTAADRAEIDFDKLGKLAAIAGVRDYPTRIKCATLCWHTLHAAISGGKTTVSTE